MERQDQLKRDYTGGPPANGQHRPHPRGLRAEQTHGRLARDARPGRDRTLADLGDGNLWLRAGPAE